MAQTPTLGLPYPGENDTADVPRDLSALALAIDPLAIGPPGVIMMWPTVVPPPGWALCNGAQVDAVQNPKLAALLGQAGGTVALPDLRDRFPAGAGNTYGALQQGGADSVALDANTLPAHNHALHDPGHGHNSEIAGQHQHAVSVSAVGDHTHNAGGGHYFVDIGFPGASPWTTLASPGAIGALAATDTKPAGAHTHTAFSDAIGNHQHVIDAALTGVYMDAAGAGAAHENRPKFIALGFIIKLG